MFMSLYPVRRERIRRRKPYEPPAGFTRVGVTAEELAEYRRTHSGHYPERIHRLKCDRCDKVIWGSGLGIGSHRRACKGEQS
jgi:hypothetical protein